ncbi:MAG: hypothetical protein IPO39_04705 [Bacteroidetes bacterium]|nr:hypothetical protein [Bacteroidota bacterium]MBK9524051.1 hypothetical protein [Bacteroidota bacterium]MBK9541792.1 hypothetical protein [Bacteroidota bacterium]MBP6403249.1 hypothetical protein [Bacteroidia bacterium]MBP6648052.1 hypothetical protein [Bacteroidia bacterium]
MKSFKNNNEFFLNTLHPDVGEHTENVNAFNIYTQDKFNTYLKKLGADEIGTVTEKEMSVIEKIKEQIEKLKKENQNVDKDRLEFDLAIIFHSNLKKLNWGRWLLDDYNMWRWLSMNYFLKEVLWRRGEEKKKKGLVAESAKATYDHLVGKRTRDIFPRRYFIIGERLFDSEKKYELLQKLSTLSKESRSGGFGNLISNMVDTKLLSPKDYVSKSFSEILFTEGKLADDKEVLRAFVRYNSYKKRLLNMANKDIYRNEICIG